MHKGLLISFAALAAAAPRPLLDLPILSSLDLPTKDLPVVSELLTEVEDLTDVDLSSKELPVVSDILTEVEDLTHLDLPLNLELPEVSTLLTDLEKLLKLELPLELELPEIRSLLSEVESIVGGELPPVTELLAKVEALIGELLDIDALQDLPSVQDLLLEIDSLTEGLKKRGIIVDIENAGIDILNSQDIVPLENTLSEFNQDSTPSSSNSAPAPSKGTVWPMEGLKSEGKGTRYVSTFDDLEPVLGQVALQQVGPYNGLDYNGLALVELGIIGDIDTGVIPKSAPNAAYYGQVTDLLYGPANITTDYEGSVTESFDFESFWFGCTKDTVETVSRAPNIKTQLDR
jgi:hypothetical protein